MQQYRKSLITTLSEQYIQHAITNPLHNERCIDLHPGVSCNIKMIHQFFRTCQSLYKMYILVHVIPLIIFKRKKFMQKPGKESRKLVVGFVKSLLFSGGYVMVLRRMICFITQHFSFTGNNGKIGAWIAGITLKFEPVGRQSQIALYCLNKALQTIYNKAIRRNYPVRIPSGECLVLGVAVGIICYYYMDCPKAIRDNYKKVIDQLLDNI